MPKDGFRKKRSAVGTLALSRVETEERRSATSSLGVRPARAFAQASLRGGDLAATLRSWGPRFGHGWAFACSGHTDTVLREANVPRGTQSLGDGRRGGRAEHSSLQPA